MYSTAWVDDCIQERKLINHYLPTYRLRTGTRSIREPFTIADDRLLREFVRTKKEAGAKMSGNLVYEEFAQMVSIPTLLGGCPRSLAPHS